MSGGSARSFQVRGINRARLLLGALALAGCSAATQTPAPAVGQPGVLPPWLPPYNQEQLALLEPANEPVLVPAQPTYPDLSVFRYAKNQRLDDPRDAMRTTKIVADIVSESPRMYTVAEIQPRVANTIAQYGPPGAAKPDAWKVAKRDSAGRLVLVTPKVDGDAKDALEDGARALAKGDKAGALEHFREAVKLAPGVPAPRVELARALALDNKLKEAEEEFREVLHIDPTLAAGHAGLATVLLAGGDRFSARISVAHALAYHPHEKEAVELAARLAPDAKPRPTPFPIFLEVDKTGVVRVGTGPTVGARMYAGCRAIMRYEPELRSALFDLREDDPYFLSASEEMFCIDSAIGAFVAERAVAREQGAEAPEDEQTAALMGLAHTEGLLGFVMYEILGRHRPEHARLAPGPVHKAMMEYVQRHILDYDPGPSFENFVASREP